MSVLSLSETHARLHAALEQTLVDVLVALIDKDAAAARRKLGQFRVALDAHVAIEECEVLPLLTARASAAGIDAGPRAPVHIEPEHRLLERACGELRAALEALDERPQARELVDVLPLAYRLRGVYEHHSEREARLYPLLDDSDDADALARALSSTP